MMDNGKINILVTLDRNYIHCFNTMLYSLLRSDPETDFDVYLMNGGSIGDGDLALARRILGGRGKVFSVRVDESGLADAPTTDRYPREMYYRIFAAKHLPETLDRILYLDPDITVIGSLGELYRTPMDNGKYFAAASHIGTILHLINELRLDMEEESPYINSGVMLINLGLLRREQRTEDVYAYIDSHRGKLILPDQDIISGLYGDRIIPLDPFRYNMTERLLIFHPQSVGRNELDFVRKNSAVIHYCGRNKPWKSGYIGKLGIFYKEAAEGLARDYPAVGDDSEEYGT